MNTVAGININKEILFPQKWKSEKDRSIDFDYVIDAYLEGKRVGKEQAIEDLKAKLTKELQENITKAIGETEKLITIIGERGFEVKDTWLKIQPHIQADFLISVSLDSFLSEKFKDLYSLARQYKRTLNNNLLSVNYSFIPYSESVNEAQLKYDGYSLKRNGQ